MSSHKSIAIIPARSGSKGLAHKNIRLLAGIPLLAHSILCAKQSGLFDEIYVSTDSQEYADIAVEYGATVPFLRDVQLASDTASSWDVVKDALAKYELLDKTFDSVALLQPTSPLRTYEDITQGFRLFEQKQANSVISVCKTEHSPLWCGTLPEDNSLAAFIPDIAKNNPRQALEQYYRLNGAIYIMKTTYLKGCLDLYADGCYAYIMPKERSVDIDDEFDFLVAEMSLKYSKQ